MPKIRDRHFYMQLLLPRLNVKKIKIKVIFFLALESKLLFIQCNNRDLELTQLYNVENYKYFADSLFVTCYF
jgi:hypothetical protein